MNDYFDDCTFTKIDFTKTKIKKGEYDNCRFVNCNFEGINASNIQFLECEFIDCNFSNTNVKNTAFKDVQFINCKLLGVKFHECDGFLLQLQCSDCQLQLASFYRLKIPKTRFKNCNLQEVDFTEANISSAVFDHCDLKNTIFNQTNLEKTNFVTAYNYVIHPEENRLKGAKFSKEGVIGLLSGFGVVIE